MALTNAEKQKRWRDRRNTLAKEAAGIKYLPLDQVVANRLDIGIGENGYVSGPYKGLAVQRLMASLTPEHASDLIGELAEKYGQGAGSSAGYVTSDGPFDMDEYHDEVVEELMEVAAGAPLEDTEHFSDDWFYGSFKPKPKDLEEAAQLIAKGEDEDDLAVYNVAFNVDALSEVIGREQEGPLTRKLAEALRPMVMARVAEITAETAEEAAEESDDSEDRPPDRADMEQWKLWKAGKIKKRPK